MNESNDNLFLKKTLAGRTESSFGEPETKSHEVLRTVAETHVRKTITEYSGEEVSQKIWDKYQKELMDLAEKEIQSSADFHLAYEKDDITEEGAYNMLTLGDFTKNVKAFVDSHYDEFHQA